MSHILRPSCLNHRPSPYICTPACAYDTMFCTKAHTTAAAFESKKKTHFFVIIYRWSTWRHKRAPKSGWWQQNSSVKVKESHRERNNKNFRQHQQKRQQLEGEHQSSTATTKAKRKKSVLSFVRSSRWEFLTLRRAIVEKSKVIAD